MTPMRLIQNFRGLRATVISPAMPEALQAGLGRLGLLVAHWPDAGGSFEPDLRAERDVLIIDGDPGISPGLMAQLTTRKQAVPVIGMVGTEAPSRLRMLMEAGATAFLRKPVHGGDLYSSLFLGINAHRRRHGAEERLAEHERRRRGRRAVVKAILQMMNREALDDDAAYEVLRRAAMRARVGVEDFCEAWLRETNGTAGPAAPQTTGQERDHA